MGNHATDGLVEDSRWSTEMERTFLEILAHANRADCAELEYGEFLTSSGWVVSGHLSEVCVVLYYNPIQVRKSPCK